MKLSINKLQGSQYDAGPCVVLHHTVLPALVDTGLELESILVFCCIVTLVDALYMYNVASL